MGRLEESGSRHAAVYVLPIVDVANILATGPAEYNEDFTQVTFRLREGVYWSDGVEFTAADVVFTIEFLRDTPGLNWHAQMQEVESVYAPDRYTVVVGLTEPNLLSISEMGHF